MIYKLITYARRIPTGATVTRISGVKKFKVHRNIAVDGKIKVSSFTGGTVLLAENGSSNYSIISGDAELLWYVEGADLLEVLSSDGYRAY